jgi:anti-sigma B factor antagonist
MPEFQVLSRTPGEFALTGEMDMATAPQFDEAVKEAIDRGAVVVLDMSAVTFVDSSGLHAIVKAAKSLPSGCLIVDGLQDEVRRVFEITGASRIPRLYVVPPQPAGRTRTKRKPIGPLVDQMRS